MPLILGTNSIKDTGYDVANSCRFNDDDSPNMQKTISTTGNRKTATFSTWIKKSKLGEQWFLNMGGNYSTGYNTKIGFDSNDRIFIIDQSSGTNLRLQCTQSFRDTSAWYNFIVVFDTTQGTASNRVKFFVNGSQVTSFGTETYPDQNEDLQFNLNTSSKNLAVVGSRLNNVADNFDGYLAETVWIDGTAYGADSFGEFDEDSGIWKPIDVSGLTFGTNGFYLDFENSGSLGADVSGNGNNFTVNNLTSIDQTTDTPTNNFATINPLFNDTANIATMSDGNLTILSTTGAWTTSPASLAFSSGKWYYEVKWLTGTGGDFVAKVGWGNPDKGKFMETQGSILYRNSNGQKYIDNSGSSYGATWTSAGDIIGVAIDVDGGTVTFYKNGSSQGDITISGGLDDGTFIIPFIQLANTDKVSVNFGNPPYTISSGNSDGNGFGQFEYAPPSGYLSLCTKNLATDG